MESCYLSNCHKENEVVWEEHKVWSYFFPCQLVCFINSYITLTFTYRYWYVSHSQDEVFETRLGIDSYKVDLEARSCTCRLWDLTGIPCVHANATINYIHHVHEEYINGYFTKEKFLQTYSTNIQLVNGSSLWEKNTLHSTSASHD